MLTYSVFIVTGSMFTMALIRDLYLFVVTTGQCYI